MVAIARETSWLRRTLLVLAFAALALRMAVPAGFMPGAGGSLVICPGSGPMAMSAHHGGSEHSPTGSGDHPCPFAAIAAPADIRAPESVPLLAPRIVATALPARDHEAVPGRGLAAPPPPSQAPPSTLS